MSSNAREGMLKLMLDVAEFQRAGENGVFSIFRQPDDREVALCIKLIREEVADELLPAMQTHDPVKIADGIADAIWVLIVAALTYGIRLDKVFGLVSDTNHAKCIDGKLRKNEWGKIMKPEGWTAPDKEIAAVLGVEWSEPTA